MYSTACSLTFHLNNLKSRVAPDAHFLKSRSRWGGVSLQFPKLIACLRCWKKRKIETCSHIHKFTIQFTFFFQGPFTKMQLDFSCGSLPLPQVLQHFFDYLSSPMKAFCFSSSKEIYAFLLINKMNERNMIFFSSALCNALPIYIYLLCCIAFGKCDSPAVIIFIVMQCWSPHVSYLKTKWLTNQNKNQDEDGFIPSNKIKRVHIMSAIYFFFPQTSQISSWKKLCIAHS